MAWTCAKLMQVSSMAFWVKLRGKDCIEWQKALQMNARLEVVPCILVNAQVRMGLLS